MTQQSNNIKLTLTPSIVNHEATVNGVDVWSIKRGYMYWNIAENRTEKFDPPQYKMLGLYEKIDAESEFARSGRAHTVTIINFPSFKPQEMFFKKIAEDELGE